MSDQGDSQTLLVDTGNHPNVSLNQNEVGIDNPNLCDTLDTPPPPYAPPAYTPNSPDASTVPQGGVMGEPTVVCRVCQQLVFIRGREAQRVVKCSSCHEATPIKAPPTGKKYIRCPCNALLTCRSTSTRISCPRANCKRVINVGGSTQQTSQNNSQSPPPALVGDQRVRVTCGHCNEAFVFRNTAHLARCPYCRKISSVGPKFARNRALISAIVGIIFIAAGVGVTVGTFDLAKKSGGIYVTWVGAYVIGVLNLIRSCYYCAMAVSKVEGQP